MIFCKNMFGMIGTSFSVPEASRMFIQTCLKNPKRLSDIELTQSSQINLYSPKLLLFSKVPLLSNLLEMDFNLSLYRNELSY